MCEVEQIWHFRLRYVALDPAGTRTQILQGDGPETERFCELKAGMAQGAISSF
ncbi:hypothetical protein [Pseudooceanicola spongiae]|uniref:hypothetical protein n=1 Tax=Pseudooceanicola spongiae TaxID=2613965 RepID=UPI001D0309A4|nr:hypothetical protein [Pseudooceanicola spongiae]